MMPTYLERKNILIERF